MAEQEKDKEYIELPKEPTGHVHGPHCSHHHDQEPFVRKAAKVGRNDPCPCGSQQKYKKCHGQGL